ncbi:hypothetical protein BDN72DRAFT_781477 [Pluteus cervinus]|uniref:Uncharacterized protein n=1 Tax=Pluteus cervinus TaxID=181527 RepID=A0ACD2ZZK4_9AGAR|nr:hypothetical protein BDN72DRAFT_781477 [Pluteus cervinus]
MPAIAQNPRDDWRYLKYSFRARDHPDLAEDIFEARGVRWSALNELPGWLPAESSPVDFMHCVMLCMIKHLNRNILYNYGMYNSSSRREDPIATIEDFFKSIIWPSSTGRLPPSMAHGAGSVKADQWRTQISVLPIALYLIWGKDGRMLEDLLTKNPNASDEAKDEIDSITMDRSYHPHYNAILEFTAAIRILASRSISPADVKRAFMILSHAIQTWAKMHCHLTPYFHLALHMESQFLRYGPAYGWWTYPYERNNGFLGRFNHNGHAGGEIEGTMMRGWWKATLIQQLVRISSSNMFSPNLKLRLGILRISLTRLMRTRSPSNSSDHI